MSAAEAFDAEVLKVPELNGKLAVPAAAPTLKPAVGRNKEAFTVPGTRLGRALRQHVTGSYPQGLRDSWRFIQVFPSCKILPI